MSLMSYEFDESWIWWVMSLISHALSGCDTAYVPKRMLLPKKSDVLTIIIII